MASSSSDRKNKNKNLYNSWMNNQQEELKELQNGIVHARKNELSDEELNELLRKMVNNFQEYSNGRSRLARVGITVLRPYLVHPFGKFGLVDRWDMKIGDFGQLSGKQITMIDKLQRQIILEERQFSSRLASLQEDVVDQPFAMAARIYDAERGENEIEPLNKHGEDMSNLLEEVDELRMKTLKEILGILTPIQGVEYLAAAKRIRLCLQQWGKKREQEHNSN
ncbi:hypothetical protein H5410_013737 [Solanum commersonii]|uniref:DOG1 domain-containing protein n=1 Tax=Solanum commersonii TaxID=4109 RepID=A0A9J5ZP21_SOLCO|nr:hypothetical protein H5410_013737 [Solanum commersonii]